MAVSDGCGYDYENKKSHDNCFEILEAKQGPVFLSDYFDAHSFICTADEEASDDFSVDGEEVFPNVSDAALDELTKQVKGMISAWEKSNNLVFIPRVFTHSRNREVINVSSPLDAPLSSSQSEGTQ